MPSPILARRLCLRGVGAVLLSWCAAVATADRALPDELPAAAPPARSAPLPLVVAEDADTPVHRIVIPRAVLAKLAGGPAGLDAFASSFPTRSIMAALALSAAVAGGLVVSRRGRPGRLAAAVLLGLGIAGGVGLVQAARADYALPTSKPRVADRPESVVVEQGGKVIVEIAADDAKAVLLVVGRKAAKESR